MSAWQGVPKVELHLHLEGAAPPEFIRTLAAEQGCELDGVFDAAGAYQWSDFSSFLDTYMRACSVLTGPEEYRRLTEAVLKKSAADGVIYTEIFLSPDICGGSDPVAWGEYLDAIYSAADTVSGIEARFIVVAIRNLGVEAAVGAAEIAVATKSDRLTGFGMAGEERFGRAADYVQAFEIAHEAGFGITSHAGELAGADSVRETLDHLPVSRIGHGVRAIEDPALVARLADEQIVLEVNPGSNVALSVFDSWAAHPIEKLRKAGVPVTVSTDDPPYFHTDMVAEYDNLAETFGWGHAEFLEVNLVAANAAFCDEATRNILISRLKEGYAP